MTLSSDDGDICLICGKPIPSENSRIIDRVSLLQVHHACYWKELEKNDDSQASNKRTGNDAVTKKNEDHT